jgi:branched-chain amino acid transport system ATP-binding protein
MLHLDHVVVQYGRAVAVKDLSLEVAEGEFVGVVGPNGAGKSTTLSAIMGFLRPTAGTISLRGSDITGTPPEAIARMQVALVPEGRQLFATMTVGENLRLGATVRRDRAEVDSDLDGLLDRFPILRTRFSRAAGGLSGGEQQQLAIARALLSRPALLMADEPTLGLAPKMVDMVFDTLASLRSEGITILLVEQNALRTVETADRTYVLRSGRVALTGSRDELADRPDFADHYLGL